MNNNRAERLIPSHRVAAGAGRRALDNKSGSGQSVHEPCSDPIIIRDQKNAHDSLL